MQLSTIRKKVLLDSPGGSALIDHLLSQRARERRIAANLFIFAVLIVGAALAVSY